MDIKMDTHQHEQFEEIDSSAIKPKLEPRDMSLLDRTKNIRKQPRTSSPSPSIVSGNKSSMTRDQMKYCGAIMRNLKKHRDAGPFLHPVDYVKLNVPDYPKIIKHPMDLSTVDRRLNTGQYDSVDDFISDIRLVFNNCFKFNGPEAMISMLCQNVESAFEKSLRQMPPNKGAINTPRSITPFEEEEEKKKKKTPLPSPTHTPIKVRRISEDGRPKREIHPPPSKDYPETITKRRNPRKNDLQMKYCMQTLKELKKNKYRDINYPFLVPVDVVALNIPDYVEIVKHPMDLATIERKLNDGDYEEPEDFEDDIRLMFNNCYLYNPPSLPVHKMGRDLEKVFDEKWAQRPTLEQPEEDAVEEELADDEEDIDDQDEKIAELERRIASISQQIASIKSQKKKKPERVRRLIPPKPIQKEKKVMKEKRKRGPNKNPLKRKMKTEEFPEFTFDQKKDLSECINNLTGDRLNTVVTIIQSSMPNLDGQGQEEIILDIDSLDRRTLHRLHEFVKGESLTKKSPIAKRARYSPTHNESSTESDSDSSSGSDSDDSGSSTD